MKLSMAMHELSAKGRGSYAKLTPALGYVALHPDRGVGGALHTIVPSCIS